MKEEVIAFSHLKSKLNAASKRRPEKPLPMPFELPLNYPPIVMADLEQNKLCGRARAKFIASIASAIFKYKNYPTTDEYNHVGQQIIKKYSFLKSSSGSGYVSMSCYATPERKMVGGREEGREGWREGGRHG